MKMMLGTAFVGLLLASGGAKAATIYATDFEPPTFTTGALAGQDGWSEFPAPSGAVQVENLIAESGLQAVGVIPALATGQDGAFKSVSTSAQIVEQSADIYLASSSSQTEWQFAALGAGLAGFAGGIDILPDNTIELISNGSTTIGTWTRDAWVDVAMTFSYATQTYNVDINGTQVASNVAFCGFGSCDGSNVPTYGVGFFDALGGPNFNDIGFMDNYSVNSVTSAPELSTWLMMALGFSGLGVAGFRRAQVRSLAV